LSVLPGVQSCGYRQVAPRNLKTGNKNVATAVQEITFFSILAISGSFDILPDEETTMVTLLIRIN
jgi:hypothetical protein